MKEATNVNILLCRTFDSESKSIINIFNKIKTNKDRRASFVIFVAISDRGITCDESGEFELHFFIEKKNGEGKGLSLYLGAIQMTYYGDNSDGTANVIGSFRADNIKFLYDGEYQVKAYYSPNTDEEFVDKKYIRKHIKTHENLISQYDVEVEFS